MRLSHIHEDDDLFDTMLSDVREKIRKRGNVVKSERKTEIYTLDLYHGSKADINSLEREGDNFTLNPDKSEQGLLWFTHIFIRGYDPEEYAKAHGDWVLAYPLKTVKHYDEIEYEDGSVESKAPEEMVAKVDPLKNSRLSCFGTYCIELPKGWYWTYKTEKFIGTTNEISFTADSIL